MLSIGHVLDYKHALLSADLTAGAQGSTSTREDLTSSLEYLAWEAFQNGEAGQSQKLVLQLLQLEQAKASKPGASDATLLLAVERNIRNVLVELGKVTAADKFKVAEAVTEFLWESMEPQQ